MSKETLAEKEIREQYEDMTTPPQSDWKQEMCDILANSWAKNKKGQIVIYAYEMRDFIRQLLQQTRNEVGQKMFKIAYEKGVKAGRAETLKEVLPKEIEILTDAQREIRRGFEPTIQNQNIIDNETFDSGFNKCLEEIKIKALKWGIKL